MLNEFFPMPTALFLPVSTVEVFSVTKIGFGALICPSFFEVLFISFGRSVPRLHAIPRFLHLFYISE